MEQKYNGSYGDEKEATILSLEEKDSFTGVTINEEEPEQKEFHSSGIRIKTFSLSDIPWWKKVLYGLIAVVALGGLIFVSGFFFAAVIAVAVITAIFKFIGRLF